MANAEKPQTEKWPSAETWEVIFGTFLTVENMAKFVGRNIPTIKNWTNNNHPVPDYIARDLAKHCGLDFFDIRPDLKP